MKTITLRSPLEPYSIERRDEDDGSTKYEIYDDCHCMCFTYDKDDAETIVRVLNRSVRK